MSWTQAMVGDADRHRSRPTRSKLPATPSRVRGRVTLRREYAHGYRYHRAGNYPRLAFRRPGPACAADRDPGSAAAVAGTTPARPSCRTQPRRAGVGLPGVSAGRPGPRIVAAEEADGRQQQSIRAAG